MLLAPDTAFRRYVHVYGGSEARRDGSHYRGSDHRNKEEGRDSSNKDNKRKHFGPYTIKEVRGAGVRSIVL